MSLFARTTEMHLKAAPLLDYISCGQVLKLLLLDRLCALVCSVVKIACTWRGFTDENKPHEVKLIDVESRKRPSICKTLFCVQCLIRVIPK